MIREIEVGKVVEVKRFTFRNKYGGTGLSWWDADEKFNKTAKVKIIKRWDDYETGERAWAIPEPDEGELIEYLKRNAAEGFPKISPTTVEGREWVYEANKYLVFIGEFDLAGKESI